LSERVTDKERGKQLLEDVKYAMEGVEEISQERIGNENVFRRDQRGERVSPSHK
jgi:hypothetical protein